MDTLAILIPTYKRAHKIKKLYENIEATTRSPHSIHFIIESSDNKSDEAIRALGLKPVINESPFTYVSAINGTYKKTTEPFIFCGADDIEFSIGWDLSVIKAFKDEKIGIVGSIDSWAINQTGCHASHFTVRREYIEKQGGTMDELGTIYNSQYRHYQCDVETIHTALTREAFIQARTSVVEHNHFHNKKAVYDETYKHAKIQAQPDYAFYESRKNTFEYYHYGWLWKGKKYRVNTGTLSVVLPSYNALSYLKNTIKSLVDNTYHPFELIIIDESTEKEVRNFLKELDGDSCKVVFNTRQKYVNANWNKGIELASGDYIAVINNDIEFQKDWDVPLIDVLLDGETLIASPYQTDPTTKEPYKWERIFKKHQHINGACWVTTKKAMQLLGQIPSQIKHWRGDTWLSYVTLFVHKKKLAHIRDSVIHHYASISSNEFNRATGKLSEITSSDIAEYDKLIKQYEAT